MKEAICLPLGFEPTSQPTKSNRPVIHLVVVSLQSLPAAGTKSLSACKRRRWVGRARRGGRRTTDPLTAGTRASRRLPASRRWRPSPPSSARLWSSRTSIRLPPSQVVACSPLPPSTNLCRSPSRSFKYLAYH